MFFLLPNGKRKSNEKVSRLPSPYCNLFLKCLVLLIKVMNI
uniref:Uncharacterized protein n=1 Tax=Ciona intestinalis TaxID=7719 RepID=H2Y3L6_CIOIN